MKLVNLPKGQGKTATLLLWLLEGHAKGTSRALIVRDDVHAQRLSFQLKRLYENNGEPQYINNAANRIYSVRSVQNMGTNHFRNCEVGVDDADEILSYLLFGRSHTPLSIASVTLDTEGAEEAETIASNE